MSKYKVRASFIVLFCSVTMSHAVLSEGDYEYVGFSVNNFGSGSNECCSTCGYLPYSDDATLGGASATSDLNYDQVVRHSETGVDGRDFVDYNVETYGRDYRDPYGADFADVMLYAGHGSRVCSGSSSSYSEVVMGDDDTGETCFPNTRTHMRLGDTNGYYEDLNYALFFACQTMHKCVWDSNGYFNMDNGNFYSAFRLVNGFHGDSYQNALSGGEIEDYIDGAEYDGAGDDWVDIMTDIWPFYNNDRCATSMTFGSSSSNCNSVYTHGGFKDFKIGEGECVLF